jgi:hypothetical protein
MLSHHLDQKPGPRQEAAHAIVLIGIYTTACLWHCPRNTYTHRNRIVLSVVAMEDYVPTNRNIATKWTNQVRRYAKPEPLRARARAKLRQRQGFGAGRRAVGSFGRASLPQHRQEIKDGPLARPRLKPQG